MTPLDNNPVEDKPQILLAINRDNPSAELVQKAVLHACYINGFILLPNLFSDTVVPDDVARADIVVADISVLDPNLSHVLGISDGLRIPVLYTCTHGDKDIPANLQGIRIIYYQDLSFADARAALTQNLTESLSQILGNAGPEVIDSFGARTRLIINDLKVLLKMHNDISLDTAARTVWYSGVLSDFSLDEQNLEPEEMQFKDVLMEEKQTMIDLARKGCRVVCIITPLACEYVGPDNKEILCGRTEFLLNFIKDNHDHIDWVVSPFRQKNCYLIGNISCIERFQKNVAQKADVTLRQTGKLAITANRVAYEALFEKLIQMIFHPADAPRGSDLTAQLRQRTIKHLSQTLAEYHLL